MELKRLDESLQRVTEELSEEMQLYWVLDIAWSTFPILLLLFWGLASFAAILALLPIRGADTFRRVHIDLCRADR